MAMCPICKVSPLVKKGDLMRCLDDEKCSYSSLISRRTCGKTFRQYIIERFLRILA
jgi:hypothetical protein